MMDRARDFLGRGFAFPPRIDSVTGQFVMADSEEDIRQAIYIILMTRMKERAMLPDFGCNLHEYIFELPDSDFELRIGSEVREALMKYEPRIINVDVRVETHDIKKGTIWLNIDYTVRATNNPNNLVFPYYLEEGIGEL
ncbi:MAG: GPW/gp25 family protein [Lachnospiraceae bacterium]|nr:GPW/gp25 family protein [Lachnospiraceae bacterium]